MIFNTDVTKEAQEVTFPRKSIKINHPSAFLNDILVVRTYFQKHLAMHLGNKLNFNQYIKKIYI